MPLHGALSGGRIFAELAAYEGTGKARRPGPPTRMPNALDAWFRVSNYLHTSGGNRVHAEERNPLPFQW